MKKVMLGLSGGVDSAVAALLLKQEGYEVIGCFMRNWDSTINNDILGNPNDLNDVCPQEKDYLDAIEVAKKLDIKLLRVDFIDEYWDNVFKYFIKEYEAGRTPNPDLLCNSEIKFKAFLNYAMDYGVDYIAMGHYARIDHSKNHQLLKGLDNNKDQTYFLSFLDKAKLEKALFPIGHLTKQEVRKLALEYDLNVANKKDSTGICFIGERNFKQFLMNYIPAKQGIMMTLDGKIIGKHDGLMYYTIGQRKGLEIGGLNGYNNEPWYVIGKDIENNVLLIGQGINNEYLFSNNCIVTNLNWLGDDFTELDLCAKFRYRQQDIKVHVKYLDKENNKVIVNFYEPVRAVTPGQACVFYDGDICLGGGTISEVYMDNEKRKY